MQNPPPQSRTLQAGTRELARELNLQSASPCAQTRGAYALGGGERQGAAGLRGVCAPALSGGVVLASARGCRLGARAAGGAARDRRGRATPQLCLAPLPLHLRPVVGAL